MNSTQFQLSRVVGPALAGVAFRVFGLAGCFFANGLSFVAVVIALWMVRSEHHPTSAAHSVSDRRALWGDLVEGFRYVRNRPRVSSLLMLSAVNSLFGAPYFSLVPIYARDIFRLGETGLAVMMGTAGVGAFLGALLVAYLGDFRRKGWFVLGGAIMFGLCITGFALSSRLTLSLLFLFGLGFALVVSVAITNTLSPEARHGSDARSGDEHVYSFLYRDDARSEASWQALHPITSDLNSHWRWAALSLRWSLPAWQFSN